MNFWSIVTGVQCDTDPLLQEKMRLKLELKRMQTTNGLFQRSKMMMPWLSSIQDFQALLCFCGCLSMFSLILIFLVIGKNKKKSWNSQFGISWFMAFLCISTYKYCMLLMNNFSYLAPKCEKMVYWRGSSSTPDERTRSRRCMALDPIDQFLATMMRLKVTHNYWQWVCIYHVLSYSFTGTIDSDLYVIEL